MGIETESVLTRKQVKKFQKEFIGEDEVRTVAIATVRYDDQCGNGHNTFSITCEVYDRTKPNGEPSVVLVGNGKRRWLGMCGCCHDVVEKHFPELRPLIKWHLCSSDGPWGYVANTVYHASDRDCWGTRRGEQRKRFKDGAPMWSLRRADAKTIVCGHDKPANVVIEYEPILGEGKERDLDAARHCAVWPDATDEDLTAPDLKDRLKERLPALMEEFRKDVETLGFVW